MSIGGALELIQSSNNPEIIDAPDSSLHGSYFIQLPKLLIEMKDKLLSSAFKVVI